ncbi:hypothetical protein AB0H12_22980 [Actinosynnema sp. NPDC023794]
MFQFPASRRLRYERMECFPEGFLVLGDAVRSFNPVYGHGMAVAAPQAPVLAEHRSAGRAPNPLKYFGDIKSVVSVPREIAAGGDLAFPGVAGKRTPKARMSNASTASLQVAATHDAGLSEAFLRVAGLVDPPQVLMKPAMVLRTPRTPTLDSAPFQWSGCART